jgi:hypothetical protein
MSATGRKAAQAAYRRRVIVERHLALDVRAELAKRHRKPLGMREVLLVAARCSACGLLPRAQFSHVIDAASTAARSAHAAAMQVTMAVVTRCISATARASLCVPRRGIVYARKACAHASCAKEEDAPVVVVVAAHHHNANSILMLRVRNVPKVVQVLQVHMVRLFCSRVPSHWAEPVHIARHSLEREFSWGAGDGPGLEVVDELLAFVAPRYGVKDKQKLADQHSRGICESSKRKWQVPYFIFPQFLQAHLLAIAPRECPAPQMGGLAWVCRPHG